MSRKGCFGTVCSRREFESVGTRQGGAIFFRLRKIIFLQAKGFFFLLRKNERIQIGCNVLALNGV